nr:hypothetical protein GCM10025699_49000 [Microbacterium flavescens]
MAKRVVVTGASSGIGAATVRLLRRRGWDVIAVARREDRLRQLADETGATWFRADMTSDDDVAALRAHVESTGALHALVNNAGGAFGLDSVESGSVDDWQRMFDVNVLGTKRAVSALLPALRRGADAEGGADIVTVTSIAGHVAYENGGGYNAAKFAEHALVAVLRLELAGEPIRVIEIAPGMVHTEEFSLVRFGEIVTGPTPSTPTSRRLSWPTTWRRRSCTRSSCPRTSTSTSSRSSPSPRPPRTRWRRGVSGHADRWRGRVADG